MDEQEHADPIARIADKVLRLLISQRNKKYFRKQSRRFYKEYKAWEKENDEHLRKSQVRNGEDEKSREKRIKKLKEPRPCPLDILSLPKFYQHHNTKNLLKFMFSDVQKTAPKDYTVTPLQANCFLLAIVHDKVFEDDLCVDPILGEILPEGEGVESKGKEMVEIYWKVIDNQRCDSRLIAKLRRDFKRVEAALDKLPAETEEPVKKGDLDAGKPKAEKVNKEAYISFTKAIEFSNGILTRKKLNKAINDSIPIKVRMDVPRPQRKNVHIQDVIVLIKKLSSNEEAAEEAAKMFATLKEIDRKKRPQANLE